MARDGARTPTAPGWQWSSWRWGLLVGACTADQAASPTDDLGAAARRYVIPGSGAWGDGDPCGEYESCAPPARPEEVAGAAWFRVEAIHVVEDEGAGNPVVVDIVGQPVEPPTVEASPGTGDSDTLSLQVWPGIEVDDVVTRMQSDHELWVQRCDASPDSVPWACAFVAFDDEGRFAGMGDGMADWFTVPMAQAAADAQAETGRAYLEQLITGT